MKLIGIVKMDNANAAKLMIFQKSKNNVFVFGYIRLEDEYCSWDVHYTEIEEAFEMEEDYGISKWDWKMLDNYDETKPDDYIGKIQKYK